MSQPPSSKRQSARQLRERKQKKLYSEDWALGDEEIEGRRSFNLQEKLENPQFASHNIVKEMHGNELNVAYFQKHGFNTPLLFKEKTGLGLRVPTKNFTINDVRMCVGSRRILDVMDVNTQKNSEMTMKDWQKYYEDPKKDKLLNVISLEFSHTKLENYVQSPTIVRQIDWVDCVWPKHLKDSQIEATNLLEDMKYPKVQKYCLMSVKGCYTDFHVDFGGTSVWYHILKGSKVFWLIPPTENNLNLYEKWVLSGKQQDIFFGDTVDKCARIILMEGNTFFIPTGWIHAVYTPCDSLVFGGNFLHSYGIDKQLKIAQVEDTTKVPQKFRYPFFTEMLWYVLERYVYCLLGNSHLTIGYNNNITTTITPSPSDKGYCHLTPVELHGLKEIVMYLHLLPANKKNVPELIRNPVALIQDVRTLIGIHRQDNATLAITGRPILFVPDEQERNNRMLYSSSRGPYNIKNNGGIRQKIPQPSSSSSSSTTTTTTTTNNLYNKSSSKSLNSNDKGGPRRRRTRCKKCEACQRSDCGECSFCLDMVKFGGPGRAKQTCNMRQCLQPMLPVTAACIHCGLDGWNQTPVTPLQKGPQRCESASNLMECSVCYEIAHPLCVQRLCPDFSGYINEDMPNSWECPMCCKLGKNTDYRPRHFRARQKSTDMRRMSISSDVSIAFDNKVNQEHYSDSGSDNDNNKSNHQKDLLPIKKRRSSEGTEIIDTKTANYNHNNHHGNHHHYHHHHHHHHHHHNSNNNNNNQQQQNNELIPKKTAFRMQLAQQITSNTTKILKKPMVVVRPAPIIQNLQNTTTTTNNGNNNNTQIIINNNNGNTNLILDKRCLLNIFKYLTKNELIICSLVCKTWSKISIEPILWKKMEFLRRHISSNILKGIVRRQPEKLNLDWCEINKFQLPWLIQRLSNLKELSLISCPIKSIISLKLINSAILLYLDLSYINELNDYYIRDILNSTNINEKYKFKNLKTLKLSGTDISDISMRYITQYLPNLENLTISLCSRITDAGIAQLTTKPALTIKNLLTLDLSHTKLITELSLEHLSKCQNLYRLDCRHSINITTQALIKFAAKSEHNLHVKDIKLVDKRTQNII